MPQFPEKALKLRFRPYLAVRSNRFQRIINPETGYQYEIMHSDVSYYCPICRFEQAAPAGEGIEYECPKCKWRYKVHGDMLAVWHPNTVGVTTEACKPGEDPYHRVVDDGGGQDAERADALYEESRKDWLIKQARGETWGLKVQSQGGLDGNKDQLRRVSILGEEREGDSMGGGVSEESPADAGDSPAAENSGPDVS